MQGKLCFYISVIAFSFCASGMAQRAPLPGRYDTYPFCVDWPGKPRYICTGFNLDTNRQFDLIDCVWHTNPGSNPCGVWMTGMVRVARSGRVRMRFNHYRFDGENGESRLNPSRRALFAGRLSKDGLSIPGRLWMYSVRPHQGETVVVPITLKWRKWP